MRAVPNGRGVRASTSAARLGTGNNISLGEHTGDALRRADPLDFRQGSAEHAVDTINVAQFIAPAAVIDLLEGVRSRPRFRVDDSLCRALGGAPRQDRAGEVGSCCARDWSKQPYTDYAGLRDDGAHTPGPEPAVVKWFVEQRDVHGFGTETIGTDFGQGPALQSALSRPFLHARQRPLWAAVPHEFGICCRPRADRHHCGAAEDQAGVGQPVCALLALVAGGNV